MKYFKTLIASLILMTGYAHADDIKVVFDLTTGDAKRIENRIIGNIKYLSTHYAKENSNLKSVVVISGKAYKYFVQDLANSPYKEDKNLAEVQKKIQPLLQELVDKYQVRFDMCGAGMKARNIEAKSVYSFVHTDKMKYVYLIDWQNKGYAYIPI